MSRVWPTLDIVVTTTALATLRFFLSGPCAIAAFCVLSVRALLAVRHDATEGFKRALAATAILTYVLRTASFDVLYSPGWLGLWTALVITVASFGNTDSFQLGGKVVGIGSFFIIPPSDTSFVKPLVGVWNVEVLFLLLAFVAIL